MKVKINSTFLEREYILLGKSVPTIAKETGWSASSIYKAMQLSGFERRKNWTVRDYTGTQFGNWKVLRKNPKSHSTWICRCKCGVEKPVKSCNLLQGTSTKCNNCCKKGYGEITGTFWANVKNGAKARNIPFEITVEYAWQLFLDQGQRCALTNATLIFCGRKKSNPTRTRTTASLDRIDSTKGYTKDNVQWTLKKINMMKQSLSQKEFIELCKMVTNHAK